MDKGTLRVLYVHAVKLADEAGMKAAHECKEQTMSLVGYQPFPICGFAWVSFKPATSHFAHWLKKMGYARKAYAETGLIMSVSKFGQSHDKKLAYARAYADVIQRELVLTDVVPGLNVYGASQLD